MLDKKAWSFRRQLQVLSCRPEAEVPAQVFSIFVLDCDPRCFCFDCSYHYPEGEIFLYYIHLHSADTSSLIGGRGTSSCTTSPPCWSWSPPGPSSSSPPPPTHPGCQQWTMAIYCNHHWQSFTIIIIINIIGNHHHDDCLQNCSPCHRLLAPHQHLLRHWISKSKY